MNVNKKHKIGLTFGAFDLFHIGHLNLLQRAKRECDELIVCVSTDAYIEKHKNKKSVIPYIERVRIVAGIGVVDRIGLQGLDFGKKEAVDEYKPDILLVGNDWTPETYTGENLGVPVIYLDHTDGVSTTDIIDRIKR